VYEKSRVAVSDIVSLGMLRRPSAHDC